MAICIEPKHLKGVIDIPPSKSLAHRAILCAALSRGRSIIENVDFSDDIEATIQAMKSLGTMIFKNGHRLEIDGTTTFMMNNCDIDCRCSGSTLRFMIPISLVYSSNMHFTGEPQLGKRPLDVYYRIFDEQNIGYLYREDALDLFVRGNLQPGTFHVPGNVSSQFISGLLFALPLLPGDSRVVLTTPLESKAYVDLTLDMLKRYGIQVLQLNDHEYFVPGMQAYQACDYIVEGDYSQAAFFLGASALGEDIQVRGLYPDSLQGDRVFIDYLEKMGYQTYQEETCFMEGQRGVGIDIDGSECPDVIPMLALVASLQKETTHISHIERLRYKESDRLEATCTILNALGAHVEMKNNELWIEGVESLQGGTVSSYGDHRLVMLEAMASCFCKQAVVIDDHDCVKKSYPSFFEDFQRLGGEYHEYDMGE